MYSSPTSLNFDDLDDNEFVLFTICSETISQLNTINWTLKNGMKKIVTIVDVKNLRNRIVNRYVNFPFLKRLHTKTAFVRPIIKTKVLNQYVAKNCCAVNTKWNQI